MIIPPFFAYAEIHYRFGILSTPLFRKRPEVIAEIPHRLQRGHDLPVLLVVKDAQRYPIRLIAVECRFTNGPQQQFQLNKSISELYRDFILKVPASVLESLPAGAHQVHIKIEYELRGKRHIVFNDNYPGTSRKALEFFLSEDALPRFPGWLYGDLHTHTFFTNDQVEFGATLESTATLSRAIGLHFLAATDHSYDLDDREDDYIHNDATLPKWKRLLQTAKKLNARHPDFTIIPGEEVTVRNQRGKNVHLLVLNNTAYFPGSGDSGERWLRTRSELSIPQIVSRLEPQALTAAAHPAEHPPFLQKRIIGRGSWSAEDVTENELDALQMVNGTESFDLSLWIEALLNGKRLILLAGNDAHGAFSRNRYMHIPFITIAESQTHLHGVWHTGVFTNQPASVITLIHALRSGAVFCTNGPALNMEASGAEGLRPMGSVTTKIGQIHIHALSTSEFGSFSHFSLLGGNKKQENVIFEQDFSEALWNWEKQINLPSSGSFRYIRSQLTTKRDGKTFTALSNPIWIKTEL